MYCRSRTCVVVRVSSLACKLLRYENLLPATSKAAESPYVTIKSQIEDPVQGLKCQRKTPV